MASSNRNLSVFNKKIFLTKNKNIASYLKHLFQNEIYIYFQDKIWIISNEKIGEYPQYDLTLETLANLNEKNNFLINFDHASQIPSIGWETQNQIQGLISYGYNSSLFLKIKGIRLKKKIK